MELLLLMAGLYFVVQFFKFIAVTAKKAQQVEKEPVRQPAAEAPAYQPNQPTYAQRSFFEGEGWDDDAGCVGGSLEHTAHEGTAKSGSLDYQPAVEYAPRPAAPVQPPQMAGERARLTPEQMRAAVVMAEVLGRPVSARGRRTGGIGIR